MTARGPKTGAAVCVLTYLLTYCLDDFEQSNNTAMLVPNIPTQEHGVLAMMKAPLRPGTRPVGAATLAVEDTSTDGSVVAATPGVSG